MLTHVKPTFPCRLLRKYNCIHLTNSRSTHSCTFLRLCFCLKKIFTSSSSPSSQFWWSIIWLTPECLVLNLKKNLRDENTTSSMSKYYLLFHNEWYFHLFKMHFYQLWEVHAWRNLTTTTTSVKVSICTWFLHSRMVIDITRTKIHKNRFNSNEKKQQNQSNTFGWFLLSAVLIVFVLNCSVAKSHIAQKLHHTSRRVIFSLFCYANNWVEFLILKMHFIRFIDVLTVCNFSLCFFLLLLLFISSFVSTIYLAQPKSIFFYHYYQWMALIQFNWVRSRPVIGSCHSKLY